METASKSIIELARGEAEKAGLDLKLWSDSQGTRWMVLEEKTRKELYRSAKIENCIDFIRACTKGTLLG